MTNIQLKTTRGFLLLLPIIGFAICVLSAASSLTRPTPFDLLTNEVAEAQKTSGLSNEGEQKIDARIEELRRAHTSEVNTYATAWQTALAGLVGLSLASFGLYLYTGRKTT